MAIKSGITLTETDPANIPTPSTGKITIFQDATVSPPAPAYKDDSDVVTSLIGPEGPAGPAGPSGSITVNPNGALDGDGSGGSPLGVLVDNVTVGINASNELEILGGVPSSRQLWQYKAKTTATSGYPGNGYMLWDNATQTSAANLLFAHITTDDLDIDIFLAFLGTGDTIVLQDANDSANFQEWTIAGATVNTNPGTATSYWTVPVTLVSSGGTGTTGFSNNHQLIAVIFAAGGGAGTVTVSTGLAGDGSGGDPVRVLVDNETIAVDSNNELQVIAPYIPAGAVRRGLAYTGGYLDVLVDNETIGFNSNNQLELIIRALIANGILTAGRLIKSLGGDAVGIATPGTDYYVPGGALGTPSSGTLTNATGLPLSTGVTGVLPGANGGGRVLLGTYTASASAAITVVTRNATGQSGAIFQSDYDEYIVEFVQIVPTNNGVNFVLRCSTDGGGTYDSGNNYRWAGFRSSSLGSASAGSAATSSLGMDTSGNLTNSTTTGGLNGYCRIFNPLGGSMYTRFRWETGIDDGTGSPSVVCMGSGGYALTTAVNAFEGLTSDAGTGGTVASGTMRVYGIAKS